MSGDARRLLGGHATDTLSENERREMLRAALDDQELFDALVEEEGLRELLESPGARQEVLAALEKPAAWERVRSWFARPATFGDLAAVAVALVLVLVGYRVLLVEPPDAGRPAAAQPARAPVPSATLAHLLALPPREPVPARLEARSGDGRHRVRAGEPLGLQVSLRAPAQVLVIGETEGGPPVQVYPASGAPPLLVEAPPAGGAAVQAVTVVAPDEPGTHRLRLVVAPLDVDLGAASAADVDRTAPRLTLVDLTYEVTAP